MTGEGEQSSGVSEERPLGRSIAIAMVAGGQGRTGETLYIPMPRKTIAAKVSGMAFYDPEGARLNG